MNGALPHDHALAEAPAFDAIAGIEGAPIAQVTVSCTQRPVNTTSWLDTYDNPTANIRVWYSIFYLCRWIETDGTTWYQAEAWAVPDPDNPFHNWTATGANANFPDPVTTTYAKGIGDTHFHGQFAFGICNLGPTCETYDEWQGHAYHTTELFPADHNTWLNGEIDAHQCLFSGMNPPQCQWVVWKVQTFYSGQNFPNDGAIQQAQWYIVQ